MKAQVKNARAVSLPSEVRFTIEGAVDVAAVIANWTPDEVALLNEHDPEAVDAFKSEIVRRTDVWTTDDCDVEL